MPDSKRTPMQVGFRFSFGEGGGGDVIRGGAGGEYLGRAGLFPDELGPSSFAGDKTQTPSPIGSLSVTQTQTPSPKHEFSEGTKAVSTPSAVISVLPASSPTSSASLPSPISSPTSPASQPLSLAFAGSSVEPGSLSVSSSQMPSSEPFGLIDAHVLPIPEPQLLVNGLTEAQAWYLGWLRESTRCHEVLAAIDHIEVQTRRKNEVAPPPACSIELPQLKAALEAVTLNRETGSKFGSDIGIRVGPSRACFVWVVVCRVCCAGSWLGFSFGLQAFL